MTDRTPTTAAGRALVESARQRSSLTWRDTPNHVALVAKTVEQTTTMVLAIEAEVRAPLDVERLRDAARRSGMPINVTVADIENLAREYNAELRALLAAQRHVYDIDHMSEDDD